MDSIIFFIIYGISIKEFLIFNQLHNTIYFFKKKQIF